MDLANMDAATQENSERRERIGNHSCAANRPCRTVEYPNKVVPAAAHFSTAKSFDLIPCGSIVPIK